MPTVQMTYSQLFALRYMAENAAQLRALFGIAIPGWPQSKEPLSVSAAEAADAQCDDTFWAGLSGGSGANL